jgi:hypothetical protein
VLSSFRVFPIVYMPLRQASWAASPPNKDSMGVAGLQGKVHGRDGGLLPPPFLKHEAFACVTPCTWHA